MTSSRPEVLAIIPARGGSKGIPKKNIVPLCGEPLISYSIKAAAMSRLITRVVVSTDDEEIAAVAKAYGAEVPFLRPAELAGDHSNLDEAFSHTLGTLQSQGYVPHRVVYIFPTSPFRTPEFIDFMISKLEQGYRAVYTVRKMLKHNSYYAMAKNNGHATPLALSTNGTQYFRQYNVLSGYNIPCSPLGDYMHCLEDPVMLVDIDTRRDLLLAEKILKANMFDLSLHPQSPPAAVHG